MIGTTLNLNAFKLRGRLYTLTVFEIFSVDEKELRAQLEETIAKAPKLLKDVPLVLDVSSLEGALNLPFLVALLKEYSLSPVALQAKDNAYQKDAAKIGLPMLHGSKSLDKPIDPPTPKQPVRHSEESFVSKLITVPVRSGQQAVSIGGDLVVAASVGHGAELLADGHIHVYGALRGRALAGMSGNKEARIFCQSLDAELVSIAGVYRLSDDIIRQDGPCQIFLSDGHIQIEPLC